METLEIEQTRLFVKVIQHGGFTKAAKALHIPKSTVSKAITRLEKETGTRLLIRSTRSQTLTAAGRLFYETCLGPIQTLEDAQKSLFGQDSIVSGRIKITAPEDLGNAVITPTIARLCLKYPNLEFETVFTNEMVDLVRDGFDMGIRIGQLKESTLRVRKVGEIEIVPVAAPQFVKTAKKITSPEDLESLDGLVLRTTSLDNSWILKSGKRTVRLAVRPRLRCNQMSSVITAALTGAGVALVPSYLVAPWLKSGKLVRLLPHWSGTRLPVSIVSPVSMSAATRLNTVATELQLAFQEVL